ncbi:hypothetical protein EVAR_79869_1 [Eumeta japonica]|uniref:Uncharacterized protein n=1 Tax=Eumeta variegata TaxID=151549 RepID=A0A4C1TYY6_EUMVA|nr:hypothetical protein EVAR_79869_1 [Eumeta japonica]
MFIQTLDFRDLEEGKKEDMFRKICLKSVPFFVEEFHQSSDDKQRPYAKSVPFFVEEFHRACKPAPQQRFTVYEDAIRRQDSHYALALFLPLKYNRILYKVILCFTFP